MAQPTALLEASPLSHRLMLARSAALLLLVGFLIGVGGGAILISSHPSESTGRRELDPGSEAHSATSSPADTGEIDLGIRSVDCRSFHDQIRDLRSQLEQLTNDPPTHETRQHRSIPRSPRCTPGQWPQDLRSQFQEASLRDTIDRYIPGTDYDLDCSEFPCIASLEDVGAATSGLSDLRSSFSGEAKFIETTWAGPGIGGPRIVHFFGPIPADQMSEDLADRVNARLDETIRDTMHGAHDAMGGPP